MQSVSGSTGIEEELLCFARLACGAASAPGGVSLTLTAREAGAAAATDGSDPEPDAVKAAAGSAPAAEEAPAAAAEPAAPEPSVPAEAPQSAAVAPAPARPASPHIVESPGKSRLKDMPSDEDEWRVRCGLGS